MMLPIPQGCAFHSFATDGGYVYHAGIRVGRERYTCSRYIGDDDSNKLLISLEREAIRRFWRRRGAA